MLLFFQLSRLFPYRLIFVSINFRIHQFSYRSIFVSINFRIYQLSSINFRSMFFHSIIFRRPVRETGTINLSHSLARPRIIRTKGMIQEVKKRMKCKKRVLIRKLVDELDISNGSVVRILKQDLKDIVHTRKELNQLSQIFKKVKK